MFSVASGLTARRRRKIRLIQRRATFFFEFGLPSPPWMAYSFCKDMNPYTPPSQSSETETVRRKVTELVRRKRSDRWITIGAYSCVILGVGFVGSLLASRFIPNIKLVVPSPQTFGATGEMAIGALVAMIVCPIVAGFRHWDVLNYLIASTLALGLLLGNVGSAFALSLFSLFILYLAKRLGFLLLYFRA